MLKTSAVAPLPAASPIATSAYSAKPAPARRAGRHHQPEEPGGPQVGEVVGRKDAGLVVRDGSLCKHWYEGLGRCQGGRRIGQLRCSWGRSLSRRLLDPVALEQDSRRACGQHPYCSPPTQEPQQIVHNGRTQARQLYGDAVAGELAPEHVSVDEQGWIVNALSVLPRGCSRRR